MIDIIDLISQLGYSQEEEKELLQYMTKCSPEQFQRIYAELEGFHVRSMKRREELMRQVESEIAAFNKEVYQQAES